MIKDTVAHQNLTFSFRSLRTKERQKAHRFEIGNLDTPLLESNNVQSGMGFEMFLTCKADAPPEHTQQAGNVGVTIDLPPSWLELVQDCTFTLKNTSDRIKDLERAQNKSLLTVFDRMGKGDHGQIAAISTDIANMMKKIERNMEIIGTEGNYYVENQLRKNARHKIAGELLTLSVTFRKLQKTYYDSVQEDTQFRANSGIPDVALSNDGFVQEQLQVSHEHIADRTNRLHDIAMTMQELKDMYTQLATMVVEQGSMLDQIDYNVRTFTENTKGVVRELRKTLKRETSGLAIRAVRNLIVVIFVELIIIVIKLA
ncbi:t-SNARE protein, putative [Babesia bigemina]|uniref:t-SNARE protein, putative n=1 Tax=Babesia bigemina TaxID=5866 RepID=A0A061D2V1_BABBI|nr:t-SNARE protein, putative [Babesia bigemina]CDR95101.1 t-SNARE protein, putative [Babesia bigemina]|eukprot:XP_012767287.1 t-SNARE protein, putative [Babesia bigemina]